MKQSHFITFLTGVIVGTVFGILLGDEDRKKAQKILNQQANKLRKEYEGPIKDGAAKVKEFVKDQLTYS